MNPEITPTDAPAESLLAAVHEYQISGNQSVLRRALKRHDAKISQLRAEQKSDLFSASMYCGLLSFNLWPSGADETYANITDDIAEIVDDSSGEKGIASAWRAVGEYLSYAIAKHVTENERQEK